jgi:predicted transcriptional regulator
MYEQIIALLAHKPQTVNHILEHFSGHNLEEVLESLQQLVDSEKVERTGGDVYKLC